MFKAIYLTQDEEKNVSAEIADLNAILAGNVWEHLFIIHLFILCRQV